LLLWYRPLGVFIGKSIPSVPDFNMQYFIIWVCIHIFSNINIYPQKCKNFLPHSLDILLVNTCMHNITNRSADSPANSSGYSHRHRSAHFSGRLHRNQCGGARII
jgi:hypothetical protein